MVTECLLADVRPSSAFCSADMAVFDALRHLSTYLYEAHTSGKHHLADLYEIVQYAGNILVVSPYIVIASSRSAITSVNSPQAAHLFCRRLHQPVSDSI